MDATRLTTWRDAALILLALEALLVGLLLAVALYRSLLGLRWLLERMRPVLSEARTYGWKTREATVRVMGAVAVAFVWLQSTVEGLRRGLDFLRWR